MFAVRNAWRLPVVLVLAILGSIPIPDVSSQEVRQDVASLRNFIVGSDDRLARLSARWTLADLYRDQGKLREALIVITDARNDSESEAELTVTALRRAAIALGLGLTTEAEGLLAFVRDRDQFLNPETRIVLLIEEGNVAIEREDLSLAIERFDRAASEAAGISAHSLEARALINSLRAKLDNQDLRGLSSSSTRLTRWSEICGQATKLLCSRSLPVICIGARLKTIGRNGVFSSLPTVTMTLHDRPRRRRLCAHTHSVSSAHCMRIVAGSKRRCASVIRLLFMHRRLMSPSNSIGGSGKSAEY